APYAVVLIGAHEGIMLANFLGGLMPIVMLPRIWSQIEWDKVLWLGVPAVAVMPGAAWLSSISPPGPLYLVVASLVLLSLVISVLMARVNTSVDGRTAQVATGVGIGMGTVRGGAGGPAATGYAVLSRWAALPMVATLQPLWMLVSMVSFGTKWAWDDGQLPDMPWWVWVAMLAAVVASVGLGELVQKRLRESGIQRLVVVLGFVGASLSLWTGLGLLLGGALRHRAEARAGIPRTGIGTTETSPSRGPGGAARTSRCGIVTAATSPCRGSGVSTSPSAPSPCSWAIARIAAVTCASSVTAPAVGASSRACSTGEPSAVVPSVKRTASGGVATASWNQGRVP